MGYDLSAVGGTANSTSQVDLEGVLGPLGYTREQIASGIFEDARIYFFLSNRNRLVEDEEMMFTGFWGETTILDGRYITKFVSLLSVMEVDTSRVVSQFCDATLGGTRCGVKMTASLREGAEASGFNPLTSLTVVPTVWYDFSDEGTVNLSSGVVTNKSTGQTVEGMVQGTSSVRPIVTTLGGLPALDFTDTQDLMYNTTDVTSFSSPFYTPMLGGLTTLDMFIVAHNSSGNTEVGFLKANSSSGSQYGPIAEDGSALEYLTQVSADPDFVRVYDQDLSRVVTRDDFHTLLGSECIFLTTSASNNNSIIFGSSNNGTTSPINGCVVGEVLVYPQLLPKDRRKVMDYLAAKWGISLSSNESISEYDQYDAKKRRLIYDPSVDYVWFESSGTGELGAINPTWDTTLGSTTTDGDIEWTAVAARVIELTTLAGEGLDSTIQANETLPADFTDVYENGKLEFLTGPNAGLSAIIISHTLDTFTISSPTLIATTAGDDIRVTIACDKTKTDCNNTFGNGKNFQGFADLPGRSKVFKIGDK
tara:strand:+ start:22158 stop:23762 length:1605 start_codon:yes stop_codon:yes gene_type:complete